MNNYDKVKNNGIHSNYNFIKEYGIITNRTDENINKYIVSYVLSMHENYGKKNSRSKNMKESINKYYEMDQTELEKRHKKMIKDIELKNKPKYEVLNYYYLNKDKKNEKINIIFINNEKQEELVETIITEGKNLKEVMEKIKSLKDKATIQRKINLLQQIEKRDI